MSFDSARPRAIEAPIVVGTARYVLLEMKTNTVDIVIGPIETYEDQLLGYKAAYEAYVLVKDQEWSRRLAKYSAMLPGLQQGLPVPEAYKREKPGTDSDLNAYDVLYYAGDSNAGSKTIAINLLTTKRSNLRKGRGNYCSSKTPCGPSSTRSWYRWPTLSSPRISASTSSSTPSSPRPCSTRWRTRSASRTLSPGRAPSAR